MINEKKTGWKQYREGLSFNGELCVNPDSWGIHYYFPGIDLRYKGVIKVVSGDDVRTYVEEWKTALAKAKDLVKTIPPDGSYMTSTDHGINITIGGGKYSLGYNWRMNLSSDAEVEALIKEYEYCLENADRIKAMLNNI